ncbi:MAG: hypothetical protein IPK07_21630 [Deltaproteobacteria bacterium]|nr:hypothetical protein [Deltaproteobacteria bacterium]
MRIKLGRRGKVAIGLVAGELMVVLLLVANGWLELDREEQRVVLQSRMAGEQAAREVRGFFREHPDQHTRAAGQAFLSDYLARRSPAPSETNEEWELDPAFAAGAASGGVGTGTASARPPVQLRRDFHKLTLAVPLWAPGETVGGELRIVHDRRRIAEHSVLDPAWLFFQLVLFAFLSFQVWLTVVSLARRDRVTVFEKGYLKEHAIGALKLQHRLLGQIIRDHEDEESEPAPAARPAGDAPRGKVIPLDKAARKPAEDRGPRR